MNAKSFRFGIILLVAAAASGQAPAGQTVEKVFLFTNTAKPSELQEVTDTRRYITRLPQTSLVSESKALAVRGTANEVSAAEWLFRALDQPAGAPATAKPEYAVPGSANDVVRVLKAANASSSDDLLEISAAISAVTEPKSVYVYKGRETVVVRGTPAQIATAEWIFRELDKPAGTGPLPTVSRTLTAPEMLDGNASAARIFYPAHVTGPEHLKEIKNMICLIADIPRVVAINSAKAIVVRGTPEQVELAERLLNSLAKPTAMGTRVVYAGVKRHGVIMSC